MDKLDYDIKDALQEEASCMSQSKDLFSIISEEIRSERSRPARIGFIFFGLKKWIPVMSCFVLALILMAFSQNLKTFADDVIKVVKSVFVLEKDENGAVKAVEKPVDEVSFWFSGGGASTFQNDEEIAKKVGYSFTFPAAIDKYLLKSKHIGVGLRKPTDYNTGLSLEDTIMKAADDDNAFKSLSQYDPHRFVSGDYGKDCMSVIIEPTVSVDYSEYTDIAEPMEIDGLTGYWMTFPFPVYERDASGREEMSKPPTSIISANQFVLFTDSKTYFFLPNEKIFTKDETIKFARIFLEAQPK